MGERERCVSGVFGVFGVGCGTVYRRGGVGVVQLFHAVILRLSRWICVNASYMQGTFALPLAVCGQHEQQSRL